jgi:hypothetical protein
VFYFLTLQLKQNQELRSNSAVIEVISALEKRGYMSEFFDDENGGMCSYPEDDSGGANASYPPDNSGVDNACYPTGNTSSESYFPDPNQENMTLADGSNSGSYPSGGNSSNMCSTESYGGGNDGFNAEDPCYDYEGGMSYDPGISSSGGGTGVCPDPSISSDALDFYHTDVSSGQCSYDPGISCLTDIPISPHLVLESGSEVLSSESEPVLDVIAVGSDGVQNPASLGIDVDQKGTIYWESYNATNVQINGEDVNTNGSLPVPFDRNYAGSEVLYEVVAWNTYQENAVVRLITAKMIDKTPAATTKQPASLRSMVGNVNYYQTRNSDYLSRHTTPPPPDYYLNYGDRYARRFTTKLRPTLSEAGQRWVDRTFVLLQEAIENRRDANPDAFDLLEQDEDAFRKFAYGTHSQAYLDGGLRYLPPGDLAKIAAEPDFADILTIDGISQIIETGIGIVPQWVDDSVITPGAQLLQEVENEILNQYNVPGANR